MLPYPISVAARRQLLEGRWWCRDPIGGHRPRRHLSTQILPYPAMAPQFARTAGQFDALGAPLGPQWRTRHGTPTQSADRRIGSCTRRAKLDQLLVVRHVSTTITHRAWIAEAAPKRKACCNVSNLQVSDGDLWPACRTPNQCASLRRCEWCTWVCGV